MAEAKKRTLKTIFSRFTPQTQRQREIFDAAADALLSGDKEKSMYQVSFSLPFLCEKRDLYQMEDQLCELYGLAMLRLLPSFPSELFTEAYLPQVLIESKRVGAVSNGFFNTYESKIEGDKITLSVPFTIGGVELLDLGRTGDIIAGIIRSEFSLSYKVEIIQSEDYLSHFEAYIQQQNQEIREYQQRAEEQAAQYQAEQEKKAQEEAEANPVYERVESLFDGEAQVETVGDALVRAGKMVFNVSDGEVIFGEDFEHDDPTPLRSINRAARHVVVLGQVFQVKTKDRKSVV